MSDSNDAVSKEKQILRDARAKGGLAVPLAYLKCSGPGFLQGAITLGGGSLGGSLYLGIYGGYSMLWLQVLAMLVGLLMLSAITYVTLSTGQRPFHAINKHVNPVLGWGWALATLMANIVWCLPQFSLGTAAVQQNLFQGMKNEAGKWVVGGLTPDQSTWVVCVGILTLATIVIWFYDSGGKGIKLFELILKVMVAGIVLCFFGVVVQLTLKGALNWGEIGQGFIPNIDLLTQPAPTFSAAIEPTGEYAKFWSDQVVGGQRNKMITAAATAVGINMTFLLPYSMLRKGWDKESRGLAIFDLCLGLALPFLLATSCVVIAAAKQFHTQPEPTAMDGSNPALAAKYQANLKKRLAAELGDEMAKLEAAAQLGADAEASLKNDNLSDEQRAVLEKLVPLKDVINERVEKLPEADKKVAAMLIDRDAFQLADSLKTLTGGGTAHLVFGIGVLAMAISTIIILMLISGFTFCEIFGFPHAGWMHRIGCFLPAFGVAGPFLFTGEAKVWMVVPTSMFGWTLLPIAYLSFFLLINNKNLMKDQRLKGFGGFLFNLAMLVGIGAVMVAAAWTIWFKIHWFGVGIIVFLIILSLLVRYARTHQSVDGGFDDKDGDDGGAPPSPAVDRGETVLVTPKDLGVQPGGETDDATPPAQPNEQGETILLTPDDFNKGKDAGDMGETVVLKPEDFAKSNKTAAAPVKITPKITPKVSPAKGGTPEGSGDVTTLTGLNLL